MELVGYQLVDGNGTVVQSWGGVWGQCPGIPNPITLPTGDVVFAPDLDTFYSGYKLVKWMMNAPPPAVPESITRRQAALQLLAQNQITSQEAIDMARTAAIPAFVQAQINTLAANDQVKAQIDFAATQYYRNNSLLEALMTALGLTKDQIDQFFIAAGGL